MTDFWVFGYGSLMWNPGFPHLETVAARLDGWHRSLCVYSYVHRGTPEQPGLVLGLDRGGRCRGFAFHVAAWHAAETLAYLREREQVTGVYVEATKRVHLLDGSGRMAEALVYLVNRDHQQYAGKLAPHDVERLVRQGTGRSGANPHYVLATVAHMRESGIRDSRLSALADRLDDWSKPEAAAVERRQA
ncbi:MAG: gamma-glutamylcyclotransferase [Ancalomicrobiaceae bacterium]|nr:gamma-glutamylcyclotransferase [Ancalomicrobiaceae bacterium]